MKTLLATPAMDVRPRTSGALGRGLEFVLFAEALVLALVQYPSTMTFKWHGFFDQGIEPVFHALTARGERPAVDFGYIYGLLVPLIARLGYGALGWRPSSMFPLSVICILLTLWGMIRFARAMGVGASGKALLLVAMLFLVRPAYNSLVNAIEPIFLIHALAEQARGRRSTALALVTACLFVKPSMAYVYGFLLVVLIIVRTWRRGPAALARALAPAALVGAALAALLASVYGAMPLLRTALPAAGSELYRANHFGFFHGSGRDFWRPPGAGPGYYLGTVVGFWIAATLVLVVGALAGIWRGVREAPLSSDPAPSRNHEVVACCALMHVAFVTLFFGSSFTWFYYFAVLLLGLVAISARGGWEARAVWGLAALALVGNKATLEMVARGWTRSAPRPETAGLWATAEERAEWVKVRELVKGERPALLAHAEGATLLFPEFAPPVALFVIRGFALPAEIARKADQLAVASHIVVVCLPPGDPNLDRWPEFADALEGCVIEWRGKYFRVYRRVNSGRSSAGQQANVGSSPSPR